MPIVVALFVACLAILAGLALVVWPQGHYTRILAAITALAAGGGLALWQVGKRRWFTALAWTGAGAGAAALAWLFVPTTRGLSLWGAAAEADRLTADLVALAPGNLEDYDKDRQARAHLVQLFTSCRPQLEFAENNWARGSAALCLTELAKTLPRDVKGYQDRADLRRRLAERWPALNAQLQQGEQAWLERSATAWAAELQGLQAGDHEGLQRLRAAYRPFLHARLAKAERAWLERTFAALKPGDFAGAKQARTAAHGHCGLWPAVEAQFYQPLATPWATRTADAATAGAKALLATDPSKAAVQLRSVAQELNSFGTYATAQKTLRGARHQTFLAWIDAVRREARALLAKDRFEEAAELARQFEEKAREDAVAVGEGETLARLRQQYGFFRDLARSVSRGLAPRLFAVAYCPLSGLPGGLSQVGWLQREPLASALPRR
jgi:hypothetical protein